jgi:ketosteroid isomerase-like protein
MTDRDPEVQVLLDKQAIREATMRYCRGVDRLDADLLGSAYHPDALDEHPGSTYTGIDIGPRMTEELRNQFRLTSHSISTQTIEVHGAVAAAESYSTGRHVLHDGRRVHSLVRYVDRLEQRDGDWRIVHRLAVVELTDVLPAPEAELGGFGLARRDATDPSYDFFANPGRTS